MRWFALAVCVAVWSWAGVAGACLGGTCTSGVCCDNGGLCEDDPTPGLCGIGYCGTFGDTCGNTLNCGGCTAAGTVCMSNLCCGTSQVAYQGFCCTPKSCSALGVTCGTTGPSQATCGLILTCGSPCVVPKVPAVPPGHRFAFFLLLTGAGLASIRMVSRRLNR
jgi:hypothetical protein